ncbi:histidine phosphatase family protein [Nocardia sp. NPDC050193]
MRSSIFLVRHAQSVPPTPNGPNEYQRPLTETGMAQANQLAGSLADLDPGVVISSPYLRAVQTLEPAARRWNLPIHTCTLTPADIAFLIPGRGRGPGERLGLSVALCALPWLGFVHELGIAFTGHNLT